LPSSQGIIKTSVKGYYCNEGKRKGRQAGKKGKGIKKIWLEFIYLGWNKNKIRKTNMKMKKFDIRMESGMMEDS